MTSNFAARYGGGDIGIEDIDQPKDTSHREERKGAP